MSVDLTKGQNIVLSKEGEGQDLVTIGCGWDINNTSGNAFDVDLFVVSNNKEVAYFSNKVLYSGGVKLGEDNLTGQGDGDDEFALFDYSKIPANVEKLHVCVNIYQAGSRNQSFGQIKNCYVRAVNTATQEEYCKFDLSEDYSGSTGVVMGTLYRHTSGWKFKAIGNPVNGDINEITAATVSL